ncbi:ATP-binding protein [Bacillus paranthracis]|nr:MULTISPECIES: ATP-binding protein [Bacillus cereus group]MBL3848280.1 ATP-binding protein [Bacillus cereus]MDA1532087.1 ATP-binding protein [Bacillus cereus group sp. TH260-2LC]MDG1617207.1 ATP-binding protein [Bacillus paranthracis]MDZ4486249.1 ATP-binding protein [Bacillus cereus]MEB9507843.1 ATP-binding protein [Bacillus anthracis]
MNNAKLIFDRLEKDGYKEISRMINQHQEESVFLDFKLKSLPDGSTISKDDKRNYAKALSAFANTSGGVIVWGVNARKNDDGLDAASNEEPIINAKVFQTTLNSLLSDALTPLLPDIQNIFIPKTDTNDGFVVTYVPASDLPPHQALLGENKYYMRIGDSFKQMEHSHLSDAFGRRQKPVLEVHYQIQRNHIIGSGPESQHDLSIIVGIRNIGRYVAIYPAIKIKAEENLHLFEGYEGALKLIPQTNSDRKKYGYMFAGGIDDTVHPGTYRTAYPLQLKFRVQEKHLNGESTELDDYTCSFSYELFAQGCESVKGEIVITFDEIRKAIFL